VAAACPGERPSAGVSCSLVWRSWGHKKQPKQNTHLGFGSLLPQSGFFAGRRLSADGCRPVRPDKHLATCRPYSMQQVLAPRLGLLPNNERKLREPRGENSPGALSLHCCAAGFDRERVAAHEAGHAAVAGARRFNKLAPIHNFLAPSNKKFFQAQTICCRSCDGDSLFHRSVGQTRWRRQPIPAGRQLAGRRCTRRYRFLDFGSGSPSGKRQAAKNKASQ
jgi:hypothetical protein